MSRAHRLSITLVTLALTASPIALAHHGWSGYDNDKPLTLTGTIETSSYTNPHGGVTLRTPSKTWTVVLAPPSRMQSRGLTDEMLKTGREVTVYGYPHRSEEAELRAERITVDGRVIELR